MSKSQLIKSGWAFILGSFTFMTILSRSDAVQYLGSLISAILLAVGVLSFRAGYAETVSRPGRNILLLGVIGMVLWYLGLASLVAMASSGNLHFTYADGKRLWIVGFGGPAVVLLGLTLFGLIALSGKAMHRWGWPSILTGIWYPAVYSFLFVYLISHNGVLPDPYWPIVNFTFGIQFLALCIFGTVLVADTPQEMAAA